MTRSKYNVSAHYRCANHINNCNVLVWLPVTGHATEEEDEDDGNEGEGTKYNPKGDAIGSEGKVDVHAEETGDHGQGEHDGGEIGKHSHNLVGAICQQRVEGVRKTFD